MQSVNPEYEAEEKITVNGNMNLYAVVFNRSTEKDLTEAELPQVDIYKYKQVIFVGDSRTEFMGSIDQNGVGKLMKIAVELGRSTRPDIKLGICGEHGGDPASVKFCNTLGLTYVSCSPYRVPTARLAAAQAALEQE